MDELEERVDATHAAKAHAQLQPLTNDLGASDAPVRSSARTVPERAGGKPAPPSPRLLRPRCRGRTHR